MKDFTRSLHYLKPYKGRLIVATVCVLLIALLWGGGLAMLIPGMKVLIDPDGLHGWARNNIIGDRLRATVHQTSIREEVRLRAPDGPLLTWVVQVDHVQRGGPADEAGIAVNEWIVGIEDAEGNPQVLGADDLSWRFAAAGEGTMPLVIYNPFQQAHRTVHAEMASLGVGARALGAAAGRIPEPPDRPGRFVLLVWLLALGGAITIVREILRFIQEYLVQSAVYRSSMDIRCMNYDVALRLPVTFFSRQGSSDTMSRFVADADELAQGQITLFGKTLVEPAKAVASLIAALIASWHLTLAAMIAGPPAWYLIRALGKRMRRASRGALESRSGILARLSETLAGIRVVKAYTMEGTERRRFFRVNRELLAQQRRMAAIDAAASPAIEAMGVMGGLVAAGIAGYYVLHGRMDPIIFIGWLGLMAAIFDPMRKLAKVATRFQRADAAAARVFELTDRLAEAEVPGRLRLDRHVREIEFRDVHYRYPGARDSALNGIDLKIQAGQRVAIVGPNGCGKTTLVSLVPRLMDPTQGAVLIDGVDVREGTLKSLRKQIALVTQDTVLFHATIAQNISYGLRNPAAGQIADAARRAYVDEFVRTLPEGYETMVGEHGATLSGGQKQRISIARAILRDPAILIFDEATSQIDSDSEMRIHQAMEEFMVGRTALIIAHRFSTIVSSDVIAVMDAGRIIDAGTHEQLVERCGLYRQLYRTQFLEAPATP